MLLADFASDIFAFLERALVGSSLLANRGLHDVICRLKHRLPVHHLACPFKDGSWRDLSYTAVRRFTLPSAAGAQDDCALIRRYFSNCYVADLQTPQAHFPFAIKMLADLASRNFSAGRVALYAEAKRLSDYRSMNAVFGDMRMRSLHLNCEEQHLVDLVKTTDFFRMATVHRLRELELTLSKPSSEGRKPRGKARSKSPLWVSGIYLLRNCEFYRVNYWTARHLRLIERKMVQICEEFERGKIADIVAHFQFTSNREMNYVFSRDNLLSSGIKVEGERHWDRINNFKWEVYRFRNASTSQYLTACVGRNGSFLYPITILHILKGEVDPDASFADY